METTSIIIGLLCLVLIISPIFLLNLSRKRKGQKLLATIQSQASKNNGKIIDYEHWNSYAIGIDSISGKIYYWSKIKKNDPFQEIDLSQVQSCKITNLRDADYSDTETLILEFTFVNKTTNRNIEFYNSNYDGLTMHNEFQLAEKWLKTIEKCRETLKKK
jgi:hypothetical protein